MRFKTTIIVFAFLVVNSIVTVKSLTEVNEDGFPSQKGTIFSRIEETFPPASNELKASINNSISNSINSTLSKLLSTPVGKILSDLIFNTPKFVRNVNTFLDRDVLILNGTRLSVSFQNLTEIVRLQAYKFLETNLGMRGFFFSLAQSYVNKLINDFGLQIKPVVNQMQFTVLTQTNLKQSTVKANLRNIVIDVVILLIKPFQPRVNQTLIDITTQLLNFYKPILPNDYFQSIITCVVNQSVMKAIDVVEVIREKFNGLFVTHEISKRSADVTAGGNGIKSRSLISFILEPIRFLIAIIFTPIHRILKSLSNYIFITLRPVVGKLILSPIESIVLAILNLIPCWNC